MRKSQSIRESPVKIGAMKSHEGIPMAIVRRRFFVKNLKSNPCEYDLVARSERYHMGIQERPTASADPTTQKK